MRTHSSRDTLDRIDSALIDADSRTSSPKSASVHLLQLSSRPGRHRCPAQSVHKPPTLRNEMAELPTDIDGLAILFRFLIKDVVAKMQSDAVSKDADIHSLLSITLEKIVNRICGSLLRRGDPSERSLAIAELITSGESLVRLPASSNQTVLRVGSLEIDLIDRTAKRGDRQIDLRPREFQLLKYMMQRTDKLLTRATLLKEVWHYKFVPETNLVDVHMGRLRRKVDGANDIPMIRCVRGVGFVLGAPPLRRVHQQDRPNHQQFAIGDRSRHGRSTDAIDGTDDTDHPDPRRGVVHPSKHSTATRRTQ